MRAFRPARRTSLVTLSVLAASPLVGHAQNDFPDRPIRLVVPYAPGGSGDQVARALAEHIGKTLGQPVIVDNKPGGNTIIAAETVARSKPDGYTLFLSSNASLVLNGLLRPKLQYDARRDFASVALVTNLPLVIVVNPSVPAKDIGEFIAYVKANPDKLNFASVGVGNPLHLAVELFLSEIGSEMAHVPYQGSAPALTAVIGGEVQVFFDVVSTALPLIQAGRVRALAVTGRERLPVLPELPTLAESGLKDFEAATWFGVSVPKATPEAIVARLNEAVGAALADPAFSKRFEGQGLLAFAPNTPAEMDEFVARDREKWAEVIKAKNITLD
ncbi:MAG TPA: tripartite tricarboxylate transporter substrate binding protein [Burkholderiaceae bacterium]|nr:tripartite tricarboxylate transporter substrate binding protein [Burkholderiaceae bacterium]